MQTSTPSFSRILVMVVFALSCFGLLLFLWLSFGGPIPLKPKGYRFEVAFPEATQLGTEADVRIAGVPVSKATRAILRQKTILGETYVELVPGGGGSQLPEGGRLPDGQVADAVQLD